MDTTKVWIVNDEWIEGEVRRRIAAELGRKGGLAKSPAKTRVARLNAKKPRKTRKGN